MSLRKQFAPKLCRAVLLGAVLLAAGSGWGQDTNATRKAAQRLPLDIAVLPGEIVGNEQVIRQLVKCGTNEFMFMMPAGVRSDVAKPQTLGLASIDGRYHLEFCILSLEQSQSDPKTIQNLKTRALEAHPKALSLEEFSTVVAGREAHGLQFRETLPPFGEHVVRIVWVPCSAGIAEFTLNTSAERTSAAVQMMDTVLVTLRSNEHGKLEIIRRSDKS